MLDFGTSCYLHPGFDLSLFFLTSTTPELRRGHLDSLLRRYHSTLLRVVGECSGGEEDLKDYYKYEDLMDDYRYQVVQDTRFFAFDLTFLSRHETISLAQKLIHDMQKQNVVMLELQDSCSISILLQVFLFCSLDFAARYF